MTSYRDARTKGQKTKVLWNHGQSSGEKFLGKRRDEDEGRGEITYSVSGKIRGVLNIKSLIIKQE